MANRLGGWATKKANTDRVAASCERSSRRWHPRRAPERRSWPDLSQWCSPLSRPPPLSGLQHHYLGKSMPSGVVYSITGKLRTWWRARASPGSPHRSCSTDRSTAMFSRLTSIGSWCPCSPPGDIVVMDTHGSHKGSAYSRYVCLWFTARPYRLNGMCSRP